LSAGDPAETAGNLWAVMDNMHQGKMTLDNRETLLESMQEVNLFYSTLCPSSLLQYGVACRGLDGLINAYMDSIVALAVAEDLDVTHPDFVKAHGMLPTLRAWLQQSQDLVFEDARTIFVTSRSVMIGMVATAVPYFFIGGAFVVSFFMAVNRINSRAASLLLLVPLKVLNKIDSVKAFLDNDGHSSAINAKQFVEEQERRTKAILEGCPDAIVVMNEAGVIETANAAAEQLLGRGPSEVVGNKVSQFMAPESARGFDAALTDVVREARRGRRKAVTLGNNSELALLAKDGTSIQVLASTSTAITSTGVTFAAFFRDIRRIKEREAALEQERRRANMLLLNVLPKNVSEALTATPGQIIAQRFDAVSVMFADIAGFTPLASGMEPLELVEMLNSVFGAWDKLCPVYGVEKIKTIGDCFVAATGLPVESLHHAEQMVEFCIAMLEELAPINASRIEAGKPAITFRIGVHSGAGVVAGVIGLRKWAYEIWGDTVQMAAKLETAGVPNRIQVSAATRDLLKDTFLFESRGKLQLGPGTCETNVECFLLSEGQKPKHRHHHPFHRVGTDTDTGSGSIDIFGSLRLSQR
jgi:PAS domain S-box-containing protein